MGPLFDAITAVRRYYVGISQDDNKLDNNKLQMATLKSVVNKHNKLW